MFAGGCVRDLLRGVDPTDYDIATSAIPSQVQEIFPKSQAVGAHFGVVIVRAGGHHFEVATFREDGDYGDGRRPTSVRFTTAEQDAQRRDFTINGLFFDPVGSQVLDYVGGQADLSARIVRAIGDPSARFREDHLRLMRAVRFATVLDFQLEPATWAAVCADAPRLAHIAIERVRDEFVKTLMHPRRVRGFDLLCDSGLMAQILPEILALKGCEQPPEFHPEGDVFVHTRLMMSLLPPIVSTPLLLAVLLHDVAKPATRTWDEAAGRVRFNGHDKLGAVMTDDILRRLRFPNDIIAATTAMVANHMAFMNVQQLRPAKLRRFMARATFPDEIELHRVDCLGSNGLLDNLEFLQEKQREFANEPLIPPRLVDGNDLMALGVRKGPALGRLLEEIQTLQLEGRLHTKEDALDWVRGQVGGEGKEPEGGRSAENRT
ncbi:MAG: CCA tRNA nucleotidyltransferase [Verrucomicrobiales bacterium]